MDRKTKNILNSVTRELFEAGMGPAVSTSTPVEVVDDGPLTAKELDPQYAAEEFDRTRKIANTIYNSAHDAADRAQAVASHYNEARAIQNQIASDKVSRAIGDVADKFRQERNEAISRGASPDVRMRDPNEEEAKEITYNTFKDKLMRDRNPHGFMDYDPALGDANPWYVKAGQWVGENPGYAAMAAGAPLALAAGAYYLNKRRKGNK